MGLQRALGALVTPLVLGLALAAGMPAAQIGANGTPIRIVLSYLNGISNFGTQNATGVAELVTSEGEARVAATGLQRLQDGEQYHAWISNSRSERLWLGAFEVNEQGVGRLDRVITQGIPDVPDKNWDLMALTVEQGATQPGTQSSRISIAGRLPAAPGARPGQLPNTSGTPVAGASTQATAAWSGLSRDGMLLLALLVIAAVGFGLGLSRPHRRTAVTPSDPSRDE